MLETQRLILRKWNDSDLDILYQMNADPVVMRYFEKTLTRKESDKMLLRFEQLLTDHGFTFFAAELKSTGDLIGMIGLGSPRGEGLYFAPCIEVGWRLRPEFWGKGYATEGAQASLELGFNKHGLKEIIAQTAVQNTPSRKVMERLGMTYQVGGDYDHPLVPEGHPVRRHVLYKITQEEFNQRRGG
ncbi:MAG: GNAT family N-acetyltransferase [Xanthomonadaceae bacterium]|nr:GNAT family N-acetyltransferase [Xanthomonadaceae bacterium]